LVRGGGTPAPDSKDDLAKSLLQRIDQLLDGQQLVAVGHRVVHGGSDYAAPVRIDARVVEALERLTPLAPLHQTACLEPIRSILSSRPDLPQVACFDTAFHHDLAPIYRRFALPRDFEVRASAAMVFMGFRSSTLRGNSIIATCAWSSRISGADAASVRSTMERASTPR
jgi:acetate kinase